jgi:hypothetical protein
MRAPRLPIRTLSILGSLMVLSVTCRALDEPPHYIVQDLGTLLDDTSSLAVAINDAGELQVTPAKSSVSAPTNRSKKVISF